MIRLSDDKKELIVNRLQQDIAAADSYYEEQVEPKIKERYDIYNASKNYYRKMFPHLSKTCELYTTDVRDTISSVLPSLLRTFFGSSDVVTISGNDGTDSDEQRAEIMQELINYELDKAHSYMKFSTWFSDALICNVGILKVDWERSYKPVQHQEQMLLDNVAAFVAQAEAQGITVDQVVPDEFTGTAIITYTSKEIDKNQPRLLNLPAAEFRFSPDATNLQDADFTAHRKIVTLDYLRHQAENGIYDKNAVAELAEKASDASYTTWEESNNPHAADVPNESDTGRRKLTLYECYVKLNLSEDPNALLTDVIVTISNGVILRLEENTYERHPFFVISPIYEPYKVIPERGFVDIIAPIQHTKTAILRQAITNMSKSNEPRLAIDQTALADVNDLLENRQYIRMNGSANGISGAIQPIPVASLQPWTFEILQLLDSQKENSTGVTRYNQGLDARSLNKTASGINAIMNASSQRLEQVARNFAETGVRDMMRFLIKLNQLFINQQTVVRLTNGPLIISPDDLQGEYDLNVNTCMSTSSKQEKLQNLQMIAQYEAQLVQAGLAGPEQIYNCFKKIVESLGYKNADDFIMNPQTAQQQQQMQQQQAVQPPAISPNYADLPWQAQMQILQQHGIQVTPEMFSEKEATDTLREAAHAHAKADATKDSSPEADAAAAQLLRGGM